MMNTLVIESPRYIEELEYIISKVNEAKEFWAKCDSTIYRVDRYFKKSFYLFINKELRVGSVLKCMPTYKEDHIVIFLKKEGINEALEIISKYLFDIQSDYYT